MSVSETRQSDGGSYRDWPSPQMADREHWTIKQVTNYPSLGDGFIVPEVYRPGKRDVGYFFTIDAKHWMPEFDEWTQRGKHLLISGELFLDIKESKLEENYDADAPPFRGYKKPSSLDAHEYDMVIRISQMLTQGDVLASGQMRFNHWALVEYKGEAWRARFKADAPDLVAGNHLRVTLNRRMDVTQWEPYDPPPAPKAKK